MGWLLALLAGGFLTFNAVVTPDRAASEAEKSLRKQFPGAQVQVKIEGKRGKNVLNGRFRKIDIELANLTLDEIPLQTSASAPESSTPNAPSVNSPVVESNGAIQAAPPRTAEAPAFKRVEIPASSASKPAKIKKIKLGRTDELNIVLRDFKWQSLPIERAVFQFADVEYDFGALKEQSQFKLVRVGKSTMHLELTPEALTPLVVKRLENVADPRVILKEGQMGITGARNFYGVSANFEVKGQPGFRGAQVILLAPRLLISGVGVPAMVAAPILKNVNPLYSFENLRGAPFDVTLTKVESRAGKLQVDGELTVKG